MIHRGALASLLSGAFAGDPNCSYELRCQLGPAYAGVSNRDQAVLVVPLERGSLPAGRVLGNVQLAFFPSSVFSFDSKVWRQPAAALECFDARLLNTFCMVIRDVAARLPVPPAPAAVLAAVADWDRLLRERPPLSPNEIVGLWGELELLLSMPDPVRAFAAWHGPDRATYDFASGGVAVECKTGRSRRRHGFSYNQTRSVPSGTDVFVASLWVGTDELRGRTLVRQVERAAEQLPDVDALWKKLLDVGFSDAHQRFYDDSLILLEQPVLIRLRNVPSVRGADPGVSDVKFTSDLGGAPTLSDDEKDEVYAALCGTTHNGEAS